MNHQRTPPPPNKTKQRSFVISLKKKGELFNSLTPTPTHCLGLFSSDIMPRLKKMGKIGNILHRLTLNMQKQF